MTGLGNPLHTIISQLCFCSLNMITFSTVIPWRRPSLDLLYARRDWVNMFMPTLAITFVLPFSLSDFRALVSCDILFLTGTTNRPMRRSQASSLWFYFCPTSAPYVVCGLQTNSVFHFITVSLITGKFDWYLKLPAFSLYSMLPRFFF
jgi:hypothetical protein